MSGSRLDNRKPGKRTGCLRLVSKSLFALVLLIIILLPVGLIYQDRALRVDQERFPPPGQLIEVNGFRLHLYCRGTGSPAIVFESGLGDGSFIWSRLIDPLSEHTRACAYDRPGLGWSDYVPQPFDRNAAADHLHSLLQSAGLPGPYLLVGHSIGGLYIRAYAHQHPGEVAGMVFVDSAHENQTVRRPDRRSNAGQMLDRMLSVCEVIAPTGVFRLFGLGNALMADTGLPPAVQSAAAASINRSTYCSTIANELNTSDLDTSLPDPPERLGDIPLVVLVAGEDIGSPQRGGSPYNENPSYGAGGSRWLQMQRELAGLSTQSRLVVVENSSHYIQLDQPEVVLQAILELLEVVRQNEN